MSTLTVRGVFDAAACRDIMTKLTNDGANREVCISRPVALGRDPVADIHFVWLLRECMSLGIAIHWTATTLPSWDLRLVHHLPPPSYLHEPNESLALKSWRESHVYGSCYYRKGPGFYLIKDTRDPARQRRLKIGVNGAIDGFDLLLKPTPAGDLAAEANDVVNALLPLGLVLQLDGEVISLPFRLHRWPVPADRI